jgi:hypothetical protein
VADSAAAGPDAEGVVSAGGGVAGFRGRLTVGAELVVPSAGAAEGTSEGVGFDFTVFGAGGAVPGDVAADRGFADGVVAGAAGGSVDVGGVEEGAAARPG